MKKGDIVTINYDTVQNLEPGLFQSDVKYELILELAKNKEPAVITWVQISTPPLSDKITLKFKKNQIRRAVKNCSFSFETLKALYPDLLNKITLFETELSKKVSRFAVK